MSTIYGLIYQDGRQVAASDIQPMTNALAHWQPDDSGTWINGPAALGQLMLYNTPESLAEKLPFYSPTNELAITADARIDNRDELFAILKWPAEEKNKTSDSTLILAVYEKFGETCVDHLVGDFAFAIWDERTQKLFCARDHMGVKPFFYYQDRSCFAFASEQKGIRSLAGIDQTINEHFFYRQLFWPPRQAPDETLYRNIKRLPAASTLTFCRGEISVKRYWTLDASIELKLSSHQEYIEGLKYEFERAVNCRLRSAYTIGTELSGGIDSSSILGAAVSRSRVTGTRLVTFSNALPELQQGKYDPERDERLYIDEALAFNDLSDHTYITGFEHTSPLERADHYLHINDGLDENNPGWLSPLRSAAAHKGVRTMLSGFGGDQMVTNLSRMYPLIYRDQKDFIRYFMPTPGVPFRTKLMLFVPDRFRMLRERVNYSMGIYPPEVTLAMRFFNIPERFREIHRSFEWKDNVFTERFRSFRHHQRKTLLNNVTSRFEGESRHGFYYRIEPRFPMADIRLTQFFSSMPDQLKYDKNTERRVFKEAVKNYLPDLIYHRRGKRGPTIAPFAFRKTAADYEEAAKLLQRLPATGIIKKEAFLQTIEEARNAFRNNRYHNDPLTNYFPELSVLRWIEKKGFN